MEVPIPTTRDEAQAYAENLCKVLSSAVTATVARVYKTGGVWYTLLVLSWDMAEGKRVVEITASMEIPDLIMVADHILAFLGVSNRHIN